VAGIIIYAGVDYEAILREAEKEADVILWDGGNNDFPFYKSDLEIVVADPLRPGHEMLYYPGETNFRRADVIVLNKMDSATAEGVATVLANQKKVNPSAIVIKANSALFLKNSDQIKGKKVLVIEDGPTVTHGGMGYGAGLRGRPALRRGLDRRPPAGRLGSIKATFEKYNHLEKVPAGHGLRRQADPRAGRHDRKTSTADLIVSGTPIDLTACSSPSSRCCTWTTSWRRSATRT